MFWIHKHEVAQAYGGPEEGGWWYETGEPCGDWQPLPFDIEEVAVAKCRALNEAERERAKREEQYEYTSVLSHRSNHYAYSIEETSVMVAYPERRPHYE
jgi:hypothetical protein